MIVRAVDQNNDWQMGKGRNDYKRDIRAVEQNLKTRLQCFLADCFFSVNEGIDWFNLLGAKNPLALLIEINAVILNTEGVTGIQSITEPIIEGRNITFTYNVQTIYGDVSSVFQYDVIAA